MACNKFLSHSRIALSYNFSHKFIRSDSQYFRKLFAKEVSSLKSHEYVKLCQYSTVFSSIKSPYASSNLHSVTKCTSSVAFMSTSFDNNQYHVVVTNPSNSTNSADLSSSISHPSEASSSTIEGSSSVVADVTSSSDLANIAVNLSNDIQTTSQFVEPTLASLGLCNWTPVGLVQMGLEYLHIGLHMPWWMAIITSTVIARILLLPVLIKTQKNAINVSNYMPQMQYLQAKFGEARRAGNTMEASRYATELMQFMKDHNVSPLKNAMMPLLQAPVFISFFLGLRNMAKTPVESMQYGGLGWVMDLTLPDPYYVLPVVACSTLYVVLKVGAESGVKLENMKMAKYVLQALPVVALPFCINFPAAILYYWVTTNFCTLAIVSILKIKPVRKYLDLPSPQPVDPQFVMPKKGFVAGVKEAVEDQKVLAAIEDRRKIDDMRFLRSGTGPIPRTYSYDPTKPRPANAAATANSISAKQRK